MHRFVRLVASAGFVAAVAFSTTAQAAPPTRESIDTLLTITHVQKILDGLMTAMDRMFESTVASAFPAQSLTDEQRRTMDSMHAQTTKVLRANLTWAKLQPIYEHIYGEVYTQEEVDGLIAFYRTPVGIAYIDKLPRVTEVSMAAMQPLMQPMMEQIKTATRETIAQMKTTEGSATH